MARRPLSIAAKENVATIAQIEQKLHAGTRIEKLGTQVAHFFGSLWFIGAHVAFVAVWIAANRGMLSGWNFDPPPFPLLNLVLGIEFIFLTAFVLMNQKLQSKREEHWGHLTLQVCLLTEQEVTKSLQMLDLLCQHLELPDSTTDHEVQDLAQSTPVSSLAAEIAKAREPFSNISKDAQEAPKRGES